MSGNCSPTSPKSGLGLERPRRAIVRLPDFGEMGRQLLETLRRVGRVLLGVEPPVRQL